jgi:hypothetical protein
MHVPDPSELAARNEFRQANEGRVVAQDVPDHQFTPRRARPIHDVPCVVGAQGHRLLHEHVLAGAERRETLSRVNGGWCRQDHGIDAVVREHVAEGRPASGSDVEMDAR